MVNWACQRSRENTAHRRGQAEAVDLEHVVASPARPSATVCRVHTTWSEGEIFLEVAM